MKIKEVLTKIKTVAAKVFPTEKVPVNKFLYCVLALALGWLGIHKFYARRYVAGILYLLFWWTAIPRYISWVEFIIAAVKKGDEKHRITA